MPGDWFFVGGSVRRDQTRGTWLYVIDLPPGPDRKRRQKWKRGFLTKKAAQEAMNEVLGRVHRGTVPVLRFHDLRHTAATLALEAGVHPKVVQERLGHASVQITLDTYSHVQESIGKEAAGTIDRYLDGEG
jgi:integrase